MADVLNKVSDYNKQLRIALTEQKKQSQKLMNHVANLCTGITELRQKISVLEEKPTENRNKDETTNQENSDLNVDYQPSTSAIHKTKRQAHRNMEHENKQEILKKEEEEKKT